MFRAKITINPPMKNDIWRTAKWRNFSIDVLKRLGYCVL